MSLTFMAKPNAREGNSCHIHLSVRDADGKPVLAGDGPFGLSKTGEHFLAGQLAGLRELILFHAPNVNSYKRYVPGSFAPTAVRWGVDTRTCARRRAGHAHPLRAGTRVPCAASARARPAGRRRSGCPRPSAPRWGRS